MHNGCILWGGVGTGKSLTSLAYFVSKVCKGTYGDFGSMRTPRDVYVITTAKKRDSLDWEKEAIKFGITTDRTKSIGNIQLTVDSWNNIEKYVGVSDAFFIFDEQRLVGSGAWAQTFIKIAKRNEWVLLSATPGDTWLDYIPVFVANGWYKNRTEFKRRHVVYNTFSKFPKVDRYVETGHLVRLRNQILVHMPYDRHTVRHNETISVDYDVDLFNKVVNDRWHVYEERPLRDVAEMFLVMRKVVNSDTSRMDAIRLLLKKHPKLIVFYNFDYELEMLRTMTSDGPTTVPVTSAETTVGSARISDADCAFECQRCKEGTCPSLIGEDPRTHSAGKSTSELGWLNGTSSPSSKNSKSFDGHERVAQLNGERCDTSKSTSTEASSYAPAGRDEEWNSERKTTSPCLSSTTSGLTTTTLIGRKNDGQEKSFSETDTDLVGPSNGSGQIPSRVQPENLASVLGASPGSSDSENSGGTPTKSTTSLSMSESETDSDFTVAEWNGHKHQPIPETDSWIYLVQYTAGSEGWNCIETDAMVFFSLTYSYKAFHQAHGRIDRLNTPFTDLWYYVLMSNSLIDKAVMKSLRAKKSFNESKLPL